MTGVEIGSQKSSKENEEKKVNTQGTLDKRSAGRRGTQRNK